MRQKSISVFLPVLNEEDNVITCVKSVKTYLSKRFKDWEIVVVSNGSTDNTTKIVRELAKKDKRIKSVDNKKVGYGEALKSGFENSSKELIFYTDGDNQFNINDLDKLLPMLNKFDAVSAYRINRQDPPMRIFVANVYNFLLRILFGIKIKDVDSSFKLFKREVFKNIKLKSKTGLIDAEVLIKARKNGFKIGQIGVKHYPRIKGRTIYEVRYKLFHFVNPRTILGVLSEMKTLWSELR